MKILQIDGTPAFGGQARYVYDLAVGMRKRGHEVAVSCNHEKLYRSLTAAEIPIIRAEYHRYPDVPAIINLAKAIKQNGFDVVHTNGVRAGITGRIAAKFAGCKKIVHTVHSMPTDLIHRYSAVRKPIEYVCKWSDRQLADWTDTIIAVSSDLRRMTIDEGVPDYRVTTIHSGVDLTKYEKPVGKSHARNRLMVPTGCRIVGTVARFTKQKNLGDLVRAAAILHKQLDDIVFVLVGDGEELPEVKRLAQDLGIAHKVIFTGFRSDIPEILPAFDVFAMSSLCEGHPLAMLEAMAAGLPVVAPDVAGIRETMIDGFTGCIVPVRDPAAIASSVFNIFKGKRAEAMGKAGMERVTALFGLDRMIEQVEKVYLRQQEYKPSAVAAGVLR
ncbi:MAG: glycosyltransferase family 4 protein [Armatimonadota bacterium]